MFLTSRSLCSYRGLCWALISRKRIELFSFTFSIRLPRRYRFKSLYFKSGHKLLAFIKLAVIIKMERNDHISPPVQRGVERQLITSWNKLLTPNAKCQDDHNQSKNRCRCWEKLHLITSNVTATTTTTTTGTASYLPFTRENRLKNGSLHSVWEASENMGYDLRRCNFSTFSSLFCKFGCILVPPGQILDHFIVSCLCTRFFHPGSVYMLSTQQRIKQQEMKFFRRKRPALLFLRNISEFAIAQIPLLLLHNQLALIKFRKICAPIKWH